jgi:SAM-dependent methyltransferase
VFGDRSTAIRSLEDACHRFVSLYRGPLTEPAHTFHQVVAAIHEMCTCLVQCESAGVDAAELRSLVASARQVHALSPFTRRLQEWPRGYPGDFETIEWLCTAENRGETPLARALEHYALTASIAQQHRNKVAFQAAAILDAMHRHPDCRVLSLACGSNPDLRSIAGQVTNEARFVLCDGDLDALTFSSARLEAMGDRCEFVHGFVPRVLRSVRRSGPYHLIFAGGLFDYLSDRLIARTLAMSFGSLLAPGGRVVFTNIATGNPFRVWLEYLADWRLIERSEEDIGAICAEAGLAVRPVMQRDSTNLAILATVQA